MKAFLTLITVISAVCAATAADIKLPAAQKSGGMTLREALNSRHTVRRFKSDALTHSQIADMLWSANGINRPNGKRTAPSAMDRRDVMIFAALPEGAYFYDPEQHLLRQISDKDLRRYCGKFAAPCYFILVPDRAKHPREVFAAVDTGYVSQNIYLSAQANGLGTCAMGSIADRKKLADELKLGENQPFLVHPVGIPE